MPDGLIAARSALISKCESAERQVDVIELKAFAKAYGAPQAAFYRSLITSVPGPPCTIRRTVTIAEQAESRIQPSLALARLEAVPSEAMREPLLAYLREHPTGRPTTGATPSPQG